MKIHCWSKTPYAHLNPMVWAERGNPPVAEAEKAAPLLASKATGDRVLIINHAFPAAFDLTDPVKFFGAGPFIESDLAWSRAFFGRLEQLGAGLDRLVFDRESDSTLFAVENKHGVAAIPSIVGKLFADPAAQGRIPPSVSRFAAADFSIASPNRRASYEAFNAWAHEVYYLQAFRDAFVEPAREALGPHIRASEYNATRVMPGFTEPGGEWAHRSGTVAGTSSPVTYLAQHKALPTHDARRDYQLSRLKSAINAAAIAGEDVLPWISGVSFDLAAEQAGSKAPYSLDPMYGVDYLRRMIALGVREFLYWNPPEPYRTKDVILRDDAVMAAIALMN